jgi:hypothetical protein
MLEEDSDKICFFLQRSLESECDGLAFLDHCLHRVAFKKIDQLMIATVSDSELRLI